MSTIAPTLVILGITEDGRIAFGWEEIPDSLTTDPVLLDEADLGVLVREFQRGTLPLWPTRPCKHCGTDAVVQIDGEDHCEGHAMAHGAAEQASEDAMRGDD